MGRPKIEIDPELIYEMSSKGATVKLMAKLFGVSQKTLSRRMADLQLNKGILLRYRSLQTLQLTALQAKMLENVTDEKIEKASLLDLVRTFAILKKSELGLKGEKVKISGLLGMLVKLEERKDSQKS